MTNCVECGKELLEDEIWLGKNKVPGTDIYEELCIDCFEKELTNG